MAAVGSRGIDVDAAALGGREREVKADLVVVAETGGLILAVVAGWARKFAAFVTAAERSWSCQAGGVPS